MNSNKANRIATNQVLAYLKNRVKAANGVITIATENGVVDIGKEEFTIRSNEKMTNEKMTKGIINGEFSIANRLDKSELAKLTALFSTGTSEPEKSTQSNEL